MTDSLIEPSRRSVLTRAGIAIAGGVALAATTTREARADGPSSNSVPTGWFDVCDVAYAGGAKGDGTTDDAVAIQAAIDAAGAAGGGTVFIPPGCFVVNSSLTFPAQKMILLRGSGIGTAGGVYGTQLIRREGINPLINAVGPSDSQRVTLELHDMQIAGGGLAGDLVVIERGSHIYISSVRIVGSAGSGLRLVQLWDCAFHRLIVENCGSGTASPATVFDSVAGSGSNGNSCSVHVTDSIWQGNTGTDIKLTGSVSDGSPTNEVQFANCKMEAGAGSFPFIDLDYAQACSWVNTKILIPAGRVPNAIVQQINTAGISIGTRANRFVGCTFDGGSAAAIPFHVDVAVGALQLIGCQFTGTGPIGADVRIQSSTIAGRVEILGRTPHGVLDLRTNDERLSSRADNGALVGSDILAYRSAANTLTISGPDGRTDGHLVIAGSNGGQEALRTTTPMGTAFESSFASFNGGRARVGYDGALASVVIDDGNSGANKPVVIRNQGVVRATFSTNGDIVNNTGNTVVKGAGKGLRVHEGANAKQGIAQLTSGAVVVPNTAVSLNSRILLTGQDDRVLGALRVSARSAGVSFTIRSSVRTDSGVVAYEIFEPA
jgi:hypothetical protein